MRIPNTFRTIAGSMVAVAALIAIISGYAGLSTARAQDATPSGLPAGIYAGSCDALGVAVAPLSDVGTDFAFNGEPVESIDVVGQSDAIAVLYSGSMVELGLGDIFGADHAIVVFADSESMDSPIACGNVGGNLLEGTNLPFGIGPVSDSGYSGVVWLADNFDGTTAAIVFLMNGETIGDTSEISSDASTEAGVQVDIVNFTFDPAAIEVSVGDTVTWTNQDGTAHTATESPSGSGFQSGTMQGGDTFSHTFEKAGSFEYFCEFHAGMKGTVVVSE